MAQKAGSKKTPPSPPNPMNGSPAPDPAPLDHNTPKIEPPPGLTLSDRDDLQLVHMANMRKANDELEAAMEIVRGVRKRRTRLRNEVSLDGFPLSLMDEMLEDELLPRHEVEEREMKRSHMRGVASQPGGAVQGDIEEVIQRKERDATWWGDHGYRVGLRGADFCDPSKFDVPEEHWQVWQEQYGAGQKRLAKAWFTKSKLDGSAVPDEIPLWDPETNDLKKYDKQPEIEASGDPNAVTADPPPTPPGDGEGAEATPPETEPSPPEGESPQVEPEPA